MLDMGQVFVHPPAWAGDPAHNLRVIVNVDYLDNVDMLGTMKTLRYTVTVYLDCPLDADADADAIQADRADARRLEREVIRAIQTGPLSLRSRLGNKPVDCELMHTEVLD
jgi:hypothetical protein